MVKDILIQYKKDQKRTYLMMTAIFLNLFIKTYVVGTHLNCTNKSAGLYCPIFLIVETDQKENLPYLPHILYST